MEKKLSSNISFTLAHCEKESLETILKEILSLFYIISPEGHIKVEVNSVPNYENSVNIFKIRNPFKILHFYH